MGRNIVQNTARQQGALKSSWYRAQQNISELASVENVVPCQTSTLDDKGERGRGCVTMGKGRRTIRSAVQKVRAEEAQEKGKLPYYYYYYYYLYYYYYYCYYYY